MRYDPHERGGAERHGEYESSSSLHQSSLTLSSPETTLDCGAGYRASRVSMVRMASNSHPSHHTNPSPVLPTLTTPPHQSSPISRISSLPSRSASLKKPPLPNQAATRPRPARPSPRTKTAIQTQTTRLTQNLAGPGRTDGTRSSS
jgi:hypothetical protein